METSSHPQLRSVQQVKIRKPDEGKKSPALDGEDRLRRDLWGNKLAATYSRGTYRTTTIGKGVFDGRVRDGIGSGHTFMATKNWMSKDRLPGSVRTVGQADDSLKTTHRERGQGDGRTRTF